MRFDPVKPEHDVYYFTHQPHTFAGQEANDYAAGAADAALLIEPKPPYDSEARALYLRGYNERMAGEEEAIRAAEAWLEANTNKEPPKLPLLDRIAATLLRWFN